MPTPDPIRIVLNQLQDYLSRALATNSLPLSTTNKDGRINSQENEQEISHALRLFTQANTWFQEGQFQLEVAEARYWFDFCIHGPAGLFIPVNVKVSSFRSADNLSSKEGLYYALTGDDPTAININSWERFCVRIAENIDMDSDADYYLMVINKAVPGDVFWTSLKSLPSLKSSGSNFPYQAGWSHNRERIERSNEEAAKYLLTVVKGSFVKAANPLKSFNEHLQRFIE